MHVQEFSIQRLKRGLYIVTHWPTYWTRLAYSMREARKIGDGWSRIWSERKVRP